MKTLNDFITDQELLNLCNELIENNFKIIIDFHIRKKSNNRNNLTTNMVYFEIENKIGHVLKLEHFHFYNVLKEEKYKIITCFDNYFKKHHKKASLVEKATISTIISRPYNCKNNTTKPFESLDEFLRYCKNPIIFKKENHENTNETN